jgi:hypothetical protein
MWNVLKKSLLDSNMNSTHSAIYISDITCLLLELLKYLEQFLYFFIYHTNIYAAFISIFFVMVA